MSSRALSTSQLVPLSWPDSTISLPSIDLKHKECVILGRGGEYGITDKRCSKKHVELTADCENKIIDVKQLGSNPCVVRTSLLSKGECGALRQGDIFEPLMNVYSYKVVFGQQELPADSVTTKGETSAVHELVSTSCLEASSSKRSANGGRGESSEPSAKRLKVVSGAINAPSDAVELATVSSPASHTMPKKRTLDDFWHGGTRNANASHSQHPAAASAQHGPATTVASWCDVPGLMVYNSAGLSASSCVACFDLDYTLIRTKSGRVFPANSADWTWWHPKVVTKLAKLNTDGFKLVLFTNQAGIGKSSAKAAVFREKVEAIYADLKLPFQVFVATGNSVYRKPMTGMWQHMIAKENAGIAVDLANSFYVGDAAGRQANWSPGKKKDHSCADREYAANLELKFYTPEEFFLNEPSVPFKWSGFDPKSLDEGAPVCDESGFKVTSGSPEVVVMVGFPGSGKSTFCQQHLLSAGYAHVNRDKEGSWQKCVALTEALLRRGKHVVVDNTSPDVQSRERYVKCAKAANVPVRCFVMSTSLEHAKHNNKIRSLNPKVGYKPPDFLAYNNYRSKYSFPTTSEGFESVHMINFVPTFSSNDSRKQYMQFLG